MSNCVEILLLNNNLNERQILLSVVYKLREVHCLGTATTALLARRKIELLNPDLVLIDDDMFQYSESILLFDLKQQYPDLEIVMLADSSTQAMATLHSSRIGALDLVIKPTLNEENAKISSLVSRLQALVYLVQSKKTHRLEFNLSRKLPTPAAVSDTADQALPLKISNPAQPRQAAIDLIVIGVSTGGPKALHQVIPELDAALPCPLLIVQHMPALFTEALALKLNAETALSVIEVKGGEEPQAGHIYLAQGGKHLVLSKNSWGHLCLVLTEQPPVNYCRPSVDVLFNSVANIFQGQVLAIVMTGMGRDGTEGVRLLKNQGAYCWIQDQASSVVWGMPGSVYEAGLADEVISLESLARRINQLIFKSKHYAKH
jgi:two-component system chemotaxis response regulator CheB